MELILWRHAEAEPGSGPGSTTERQGRENRHGEWPEWLHSRLPDSARILASPATRAQQTARALADMSRRKFKTLEQIAPGRPPKSCWPRSAGPGRARRWWRSVTSLTLGLAASRLLAGAERPWSVKKAAVWWLSSSDGRWARAGGAARRDQPGPGLTLFANRASEDWCPRAPGRLPARGSFPGIARDSLRFSNAAAGGLAANVARASGARRTRKERRIVLETGRSRYASGARSGPRWPRLRPRPYSASGRAPPSGPCSACSAGRRWSAPGVGSLRPAS